jgi:hypothetical protein
VAEDRDLHPAADPLFQEYPVEIVDPAHRLAVEGDHDVSDLQTGPVRRTTRFYGLDEDAAGRGELVPAHRPAMERDALAGHAEVAAANPPVAQELADDGLHRVDPDREADPLGREDDGGVDADDLAS